jgi:hypothetical protein
MMPSQLPSTRSGWPRLVWLMLLLGGLAGCQGESVSRYTVPHVEESEGPPEKVRLLGAIVPKGDDTWFFKLAGPIEAVNAGREGFTGVVQSVRFAEGDKPLSWTTPDGWHEAKGRPERYATLHSDQHNLDLTITRLPAKAADVLTNVNRWRNNDLGLGPIGPVILPRFTHEFQVAGVTATLVDMTGPGPGKKMAGAMPPMMPPAGGPGKMPAAGQLPFTYTVPKGWTDTGPRQGQFPIFATFQISDGDKKAEVTVLPLPPNAGGLLENVNRWRGQIGAGPITAEELAKMDIPKVQVDGSPGEMFDLVGPAGDRQGRILLIRVHRRKFSWYFKMLGSADLVGRQKANFESFVQSVKFTGAADE